jgi:hypothetical protein
MLSVNPEFFRSDDVATVKVWLDQPGAALLRRGIANEIAKLQIEASAKFYDAVNKNIGRRNAEGDAMLKQIHALQSVLDYLDHAQSKEYKPFTARITTL